MSLSILWAILITTLGTWWLYLIYKLGQGLNQFPEFSKQTGLPKNYLKLVIYEGAAFFILILLVSVAVFVFYLRGQKRTNQLQEFFASLTHELKTPLASIRLQTEVIFELIEKLKNDRLEKLAQRQISDVQNLETQMDKLLQLSRLNRGGKLQLNSLELNSFLFACISKWSTGLNIQTKLKKPIYIMADEFALELIFRNLFENTKNHSGDTFAQIEIIESKDIIQIVYSDHGKFDGNINKLGNIFYKHNSKKGSGIGLYLTTLLIKKMNGKVSFDNKNGFTINLFLGVAK